MASAPRLFRGRLGAALCGPIQAMTAAARRLTTTARAPRTPCRQNYLALLSGPAALVVLDWRLLVWEGLVSGLVVISAPGAPGLALPAPGRPVVPRPRS